VAVTPLEDTLSANGREAMLSEIDARIREHDVKHVYLQYVSVPGRVMGKVVPARHFERIAACGLAWTYLSAGGFHSTLTGKLIGPSGPAATEGLMIPDLATFQVLPWDTDMARVFCDHFHRIEDERRPGEIALSDCRTNLKTVDRAFRDDHRLTLKTGCEPEMSWFQSKDEITASVSELQPHLSTAYHVGHLEKMRPILKQVTKYGQAMGLDMIQADYEDPAQTEMNFMFGSALETADRLITFRQICMQVAREFGVFATFMPKPLAGVMGNGCHHHLSLWSGDECAFVQAGKPDLTELGRHAAGGILVHARGLSALAASTVNSYTRYWDVGLFAPTIPIWGYDNRVCILRVLPSRVEYRAPDAACNPYMTQAALLAAMRDGIENTIDPGPPQQPEDEPPSEDNAPFPLLPKTLGEALVALEEDRVVCDVFFDEVLNTFLEIKRDEWARSCAAVTDWARDMYLNYQP
jgi:glutamine synthetase